MLYYSQLLHLVEFTWCIVLLKFTTYSKVLRYLISNFYELGIFHNIFSPRQPIFCSIVCTSVKCRFVFLKQFLFLSIILSTIYKLTYMSIYLSLYLSKYVSYEILCKMQSLCICFSQKLHCQKYDCFSTEKFLCSYQSDWYFSNNYQLC